MNFIDFPIERINKFFETHTFEVFTSPVYHDVFNVKTNVKVKLTGVQNYTSVGTVSPHVEYTLYILSSNKESDMWNSVFYDMFGDDLHINTSSSEYSQVRWVMNQKLSEFLRYFGINKKAICTRVVNEVSPSKKLKEEIISEGVYDQAVREVVKDIISLIKYQREGEFELPSDVNDEDKLTYSFPKTPSDFSVELILKIDDEIYPYEMDADYYRAEDTIEVRISTNSNMGENYIREFIGDLNELIRHELEHMSQYYRGYRFGREPKNRFKYYNQKHELEAQLAGFRRRAKKEKRTIQDVAKEWFNKNQKKHGLTPEQVDKTIQNILSLVSF